MKTIAQKTGFVARARGAVLGWVILAGGCASTWEDKIASLQLRVEAAETQLKTQSGDVSSVRGTMDELRTELDSVRAAMEQLEEALERRAFGIAPTGTLFSADAEGKRLDPEKIRKAQEIAGRLSDPQADRRSLLAELLPLRSAAIAVLAERSLYANDLGSRTSAAEMLSDFPTPEVTAYLVRLIEADETRVGAMKLLRDYGTPSALPFIVPFLEAKEEAVRFAAALATVKLRDKRAIPVLIEYLASTDEATRTVAFDALRRATSQTFDYRSYGSGFEDKQEREKAIQEWIAWWKQTEKNFNFSSLQRE